MAKYTRQDLREFIARADTLDKCEKAKQFIKGYFARKYGEDKDCEELLQLIELKETNLKAPAKQKNKALEIVLNQIEKTEKEALNLACKLHFEPEDFQYMKGKLDALRELRDELNK